MYLKSIEMIGFKSFADRTKLVFEPGMMAIVGPNGCGKSNVSDAVRWVLGETSAKALRGGSMVDCIFNGTEKKKPMGMAEVSLTLGDSEETLGTEYNEVTVTRRVLRSGEGQYYINKTPCRLKDIQRLFMDTGVGTNSYSMMEQGRIDQILSSRPDDRRAVFEEASGITKFKADKKEALRKLDYTEANLLRLADIIKEVKRQIISLQRQAGKARRYKELHGKLRALDIHLARNKLHAYDQNIHLVESRIASLSEQDEALRHDVSESEREAGRCRSELNQLEEHVAQLMEWSVQAKTELSRVKELLHVNEDRVGELQSLSERDTKDAVEAQSNIQRHRATLEEIERDVQAAQGIKDDAEHALAEQAEELKQHEERTRQLANALEQLRNESIDLESHMAHLQNELTNLEAQERSTVIRRERLAAEQAEMSRNVGLFEERQAHMGADLGELTADVEQKERERQSLQARKAAHDNEALAVRNALSEWQAELAAKRARIEMLKEGTHQSDGFPTGAQWLLNPVHGPATDSTKILGALAEQIIADGPYQTALEAVLRSWLDAVVVADDHTAREILATLETGGHGAARVLPIQFGDNKAARSKESGPGSPLLEHLRCADSIQPLAERLLQNVRVVASLSDVPSPLPAHATYVTQSGAVLRGDGSAEFWTRDGHESNPVSRQHALRDWEHEVQQLEEQVAQQSDLMAGHREADTELIESIARAQAALETSRRNLALREGEAQVIAQEATQARERNETVTWELQALTEDDGSGQNRRQQIHEGLEQQRNRQAEVRASLTSQTEAYRALEQHRTELLAAVTERRVELAEQTQAAEYHVRRKESLETRIAELEKVSEERRQGVDSYQTRIDTIQRTMEENRERVHPLEADVARHQEALHSSRNTREALNARLQELETLLGEKRNVVEEVRSRKTGLEVELAEERMRRQTLVERVALDYKVSPEKVATEPEPEWDEEGEPDREALETTVAEIRAKLEAMGPVNLVAIEEHKELEERYAFLTQEEDDLQKAKQQLLDMIRKINKTTTEMFSETFARVNENFQEMFKQLFGGGSAKLVLLDEEDVLESGIEIIARPPGKKLQTVSLLSGGERTMTAVALLFSLYLVKPSPFCLLDELDAALDDANIGRFVAMVQGFLGKSQFIVITHNRQTISASDVLYGITMEEGVSNIISVKFAHHEKEDVRSDAIAGHARSAAHVAPASS